MISSSLDLEDAIEVHLDSSTCTCVFCYASLSLYGDLECKDKCKVESQFSCIAWMKILRACLVGLWLL